MEINVGERRWNAIGHSGSNSHELKMISKAFTNVLRLEPNFHGVDGACLWTVVIKKVRDRLPNIDPNVTAKQWVDQSKLGSKRLVGAKVTTALQYFWASPDHWSRPIANAESRKT